MIVEMKGIVESKPRRGDMFVEMKRIVESKTRRGDMIVKINGSLSLNP